MGSVTPVSSIPGPAGWVASVGGNSARSRPRSGRCAVEIGVDTAGGTHAEASVRVPVVRLSVAASRP